MPRPESDLRLKHWLSLLPIAIAVLLSGLGLFLLAAPRTEAQNQDTTNSSPQELRVEDAGLGTSSPDSSTNSPTDEEATSGPGREVPDEAAYEKQKKKANDKARAKQPSTESTSPEAAPATQNALSSFEGVNGSTPRSDSNGAIGPSQYIEMTNAGFAIYDRSSTTPTAQGSLQDLTGEPSTNHVIDSMMIWDPDTNRFFYSAADSASSADNRIAFGFSTTSTPSSAADFCKYTIPLGSIWPDFPRLGDTQDFLLIGTNNSNKSTGGYVGSNLYSITKPPSSSTCPDKSTFTVDQQQNLKDASGHQAFDIVPANQVDSSGTSWVVARAGSLPANQLSIYKVTKNSDGSLNVSTAMRLSVPQYKLPADAPQKGTKTLLDTLDAGPTQAVSAIDPSDNDAVALWAQHTVFGGSGAQVRWYEIDPNNTALFQSGTLSDSSGRYLFNAAISPDRMNSGQTQQFGDSMALTYNSSSKSQYPDIRMVSKEGSAPVSSEVLIKESSVAYTNTNGKKCSSSLCRWGDYPGASPDPGAPNTGAHGQVWLTNMWAKTSGEWGTWNWAATP
jgi:hypothetical protein